MYIESREKRISGIACLWKKLLLSFFFILSNIFCNLLCFCYCFRQFLTILLFAFVLFCFVLFCFGDRV